METTSVASSDPVWVKAVTDSLRDLLQTDSCTDVSWFSPGVALLVSMSRFGKSLHTRLNVSLAGSLVRMRSCIEHIFLSQILFRLWWSINVDKALEDIILNFWYYVILKKFKHRIFVWYPICPIRIKVSIQREEIYLFISNNIYPTPEISNNNFNFKICWARIISVENSELFSVWCQLLSSWVWRFPVITFRDSYFLTPFGFTILLLS